MTHANLSEPRRDQIAKEILADAGADCTKSEIREALNRLLQYSPPIEDLEREVRQQFDALDVSIRTLGDGTLTIADVDEQLVDGEAVVLRANRTEEASSHRAVLAGVFHPTDDAVDCVLGKIVDASGWVWEAAEPEEVERFDATDTYIRREGVRATVEQPQAHTGNAITETKTIGTVGVVDTGPLVSPGDLLPDAGGEL